MGPARARGRGPESHGSPESGRRRGASEAYAPKSGWADLSRGKRWDTRQGTWCRVGGRRRSARRHAASRPARATSLPGTACGARRRQGHGEASGQASKVCAGDAPSGLQIRLGLEARTAWTALPSVVPHFLEAMAGCEEMTGPGMAQAVRAIACGWQAPQGKGAPHAGTPCPRREGAGRSTEGEKEEATGALRPATLQGAGERIADTRLAGKERKAPALGAS